MNGITLICLVYIIVAFLVGIILYYQRKNETETKDNSVNRKSDEMDEK
jgi:uncharacterized membrane protein